MNDNIETKITSAQDYISKFKRKITKIVNLPSGATFEIKKITLRDYIKCGGITLQSLSDITDKTVEEKNKIIWDKMTSEQKEQQLKINDKIICASVVNPKLTLETNVNSNEAIPISMLDDNDYYFLLNEISNFSFANEDMKFFREGEKSSNVNTG